MPAFQEAFVHRLDCVVRAGPPEKEWTEWFKDVPGYRYWMTAIAIIDLKVGNQVIRATDVDLPFPPAAVWGPLKALNIEFELLDLQGRLLEKGTGSNGETYFATNRGRLRLIDGPVPWIKGLLAENPSDQITANISKQLNDGSHLVTLTPRDAFCCDREQIFPSFVLRAKVSVDEQRAHALQCGPCLDECDMALQKLALLSRAELQWLAPRMLSLVLDPKLAELYNFRAFMASRAGLPYCQDNAASLQRNVDWAAFVERILTRNFWALYWEHAQRCFAEPPTNTVIDAVCERVCSTVKKRILDVIRNECPVNADQLGMGDDPRATYAAIAHCLQTIAHFVDSQLDCKFVFSGKHAPVTSSSEPNKTHY
jgi:hypothetical protein